MSEIKIRQTKDIEGTVEMPGDKSISHRGIMLGAICEGKTHIHNFLIGDDTIITTDAFKAMGVKIAQTKDYVVINGVGLKGLKQPDEVLYLGNSGTSMRLMLGLLAGCPFEVTLTGDESLSQRPMDRVVEPLRAMGASIIGKDNANHAPLIISGGFLKSIDYVSKISSAQVKSAVLLAGLYAKGITSVTEPLRSRDHTERMLQYLGGDVEVNVLKVKVKGPMRLKGREILVPGDISSAAFFLVLGAISKNAKIKIQNVGLNPTRTGIIDVLKMMGAKIAITNVASSTWEPRGDISIVSSQLKGVTIKGDVIPQAIDELPIIMVAASLAKGTTVIEGAGELRVKETDRIDSMVSGLKKMGADIQAKGDDIYINGVSSLRGAEVSSFGDHRTAMSMVVAGLVAGGETVVKDTECISKSFPEFMLKLKELGA